MNEEHKSIKIEDIAQKAGVSITAVSFAINGRPGISAETRDKIMKIIRESGYVYKSNVRAKKLPVERSIMLLNCTRTTITSGDFSEAPFFTELLKAFEKKAGEHGYRLWVKSLNIDDDFFANKKSFLSDGNVDGIILIATDMKEEDGKYFLKAQPNIVAIDRIFKMVDMNCVVMDNYLGATLAAKHLIERGHTEIGYIQSTDRIYNFEMRKEGFFDTLEKAHLSVKPENVFSVHGNTVHDSYELLSEALRTRIDSLPDAFFAENDYLAIGLMKALQGLGVPVPERVAVIGFDDIEMSAVVTPGLSTIRVPINAIAEIAIHNLNRMLEKKKISNTKQMVSVSLVRRKST